MHTCTHSQPAPRVWSRGIARDAMADPLDAAEFLDVEVQPLARRGAFVAHDGWLGWRWLARHRAQHTTERGLGQAGALRDLGIDQALAPAGQRLRAAFHGDPPRAVARSGRAVAQAGRAGGLVAGEPLAHGFWADGEGRCCGLHRLSLMEHHAHDVRSTTQGSPGIGMHGLSSPPGLDVSFAHPSLSGRTRRDNLLKPHS